MNTTNSTTVLQFQAYEDASGAPAIVEVRSGRQSARFALDMLGTVKCNGLGSGFTPAKTARAAAVARCAYATRIAAAHALPCGHVYPDDSDADHCPNCDEA
jgi:hypothetical protein